MCIIYQAQKVNSIMQDIQNYKTVLQQLNESDQQALDLFANLDPNSPQAHNQQSPDQLSDQDEPRLGRLSKLKNQSKLQKKRQKRKQKKLKQKLKHKKLKQQSGIVEMSTPVKKLKKESNKNTKDSEQAEVDHKSQMGSSQFDSQNDAESNLSNQLNNLNPDQEAEVSPRKRLRKSNRKSKIEQRQGFKISELGLDPQVDLDQLQKDYSDQQYSNEKKGKLKKSKLNSRIKVPTNEEIMNAFKEHGVVDSQDQQANVNEKNDYDSGLDMLYSMKDKKKNSIKINNRFFGDLEIDLRDQDVQVMAVPENLQLQLKPKNVSTVSSRVSFLSKAETMKKQRGLQADVNIQQYERRQSQKAKKSMARVVGLMMNDQYHQDLDLQINVPMIARGKSAEIINNTVFLKQFVKSQSQQVVQEAPQSVSRAKSMHQVKKQPQTRQQLYKQIKQQTRMKRSKYISQDYIKNIFKSTSLQELQEVRKKILQRKRREAASDDQQQQQMDENERLKNEKYMQLLQKQEEQNDQDQEYEPGQQQNPDVQENVQDEAQQSNIQGQAQQNEDEANMQVQHKIKNKVIQNQKDQEQKQELEQYNQIYDQLHEGESKLQVQEQADQNQEQNNEEQQLSDHQQQEQEIEQAVSQKIMIQQQPNEQLAKQMIELEQQGIMLKKKKNTTNLSKQAIQPQIQKENNNYIENQHPQEPQQQQIKQKQYLQDQYQQQEFQHFRKLRKIALVIAKKKKDRQRGRQFASQFVQNQAEEGSDNEDHDDMIKKIDYEAEDKQYQGVDLDADLVQLIDNAVDINEEDQQQAFKKYLEDVRMQDKQQIKRIVRGQFRKKHEDLQFQMEQDQKKRLQRMQQAMLLMQRRQEQQGQGLYMQPQQRNSDSDDQYSDYREKKREQVQEESEQIKDQEQKALFQKFLDDTLPTIKKDVKEKVVIDFGVLPQAVRSDKRNMASTISMTRLGSRGSTQQIMKPKMTKTSSLINQILNKHRGVKNTQKVLLKGVFAKKK